MEDKWLQQHEFVYLTFIKPLLLAGHCARYSVIQKGVKVGTALKWFYRAVGRVLGKKISLATYRKRQR